MKNRSKGYSLIELSIVLAIAMVVLSVGATSLNSVLKASNYKASESQLEAFKMALNAYYAKYKRLPCPAPLNTSSVSATTNCSTTCPSGITCPAGAPNVIYGALPVTELNAVGISFSAAVDIWNKKVIYAVDRRFTVDGAASECTAGGAIFIRDASNNPVNSAPQGAIYALLSTGQNGAGGFASNGTASSAACLASAPERVNCLFAGQFASAPFSLVDATYYDDVLTWQRNPNLKTCPDNIAGCGLWLDSADFCSITTSSGLVTAWNDKSVRGNVVNVTNQPTFSSAASNNINGHNYITFSTTGLISATYAIPTAHTVFAVVRPLNTSLSQKAILNASDGQLAASNGSRVLGIFGATYKYSHDGPTNTSPATSSADSIVANNVYIISTKTTAANLFASSLNGLIYHTPAIIAAGSNTNYNIGSFTLNGWQRFDGDILEVVVYESALSQDDERKVLDSLAQKWGVKLF